MDGSEIEMEMVAGGLGPPVVGGTPGVPDSARGNKPVMFCGVDSILEIKNKHATQKSDIVSSNQVNKFR
jgi:hypothetical protein